ncbi:hypothetical protein J2736_001152 [Paenibacillus qinlingensis]|uniref:Uncharacterized protein n=1 Tax=Paenibacillus qinlingensis TaxID=1837343 RepID=A0ABU1NR66_9BACL|nr:hypothetical protein [Paenibacillus qinlingensis]
MNKASEQHIGTEFLGDGVTGAPVIELKYTHAIGMSYLKRLVWRHTGETGWYHEDINLVPKTGNSLGGGIFLLSRKKLYAGAATFGTQYQMH